MRHSRALLLALGLFLAVPACRSKQRVQRAEFGVFYGGQVQERREIPFELDRTKQTHGIRIELAAPFDRDTEVTWEIDKPNPTRRGPGSARMAELGRARLPKGQDRFERIFAFQPDDAPGTWNVRVLLDGQLVIDRPFLVYDPIARARAK
jgi:hypothetical protein